MRKPRPYATRSLRRSQGMTSEAGEDYRDLLTRLSAALAMTEAAYLEAQAPEGSISSQGKVLPCTRVNEPRGEGRGS